MKTIKNGAWTIINSETVSSVWSSLGYEDYLNHQSPHAETREEGGVSEPRAARDWIFCPNKHGWLHFFIC